MYGDPWIGHVGVVVGILIQKPHSEDTARSGYSESTSTCLLDLNDTLMATDDNSTREVDDGLDDLI